MIAHIGSALIPATRKVFQDEASIGTGWRERLTFANVTSLLALFVALGGTGYAATSLPANSVGNAQLKADAVGSGKVRDGSLKAKDFADGQLPAGARGATGPAGPAGTVDTSTFYSKTLSDARYLRGTVTVVASSGLVPIASTGFATATCPTGQQAIAGGTDTDNVGTMWMKASSPVIDGSTLDGVTDGQHGPATAWRVFISNTGLVPQGFKVAVICAPIG